jgi:hypothetical protein
VIDAAPRVLRRRDDYDAWAEPMGAGTIAHDAGLAVVFPACMKFSWRHDPARFAQFAHRVWGEECNFQDIERTGLAVRPTGLGIGSERFGLMAERLTLGGTKSVGHFLPIEKADAEAIYRLAL